MAKPETIGVQSRSASTVLKLTIRSGGPSADTGADRPRII